MRLAMPPAKKTPAKKSETASDTAREAMPSIYEDASTRATLRFIVSCAAETPALVGGRTVGRAYLFSSAGRPLSAKEVEQVSARVTKLIADDLPITKKALPYAEALKYFGDAGLAQSVALLRSRSSESVEVHTLGSCSRLAFGALAAKTSVLAAEPPVLSLHNGALLVSYGPCDGGDAPPAKRAKGASAPGLAGASASTSLLSASNDHAAWGASHKVSCVGELNSLQTCNRELHDFILHAEFRQEAKLAELASAIAARCTGSSDADRVGVVCIAGPTSSGKTTFATKLTMYLRNLGFTGRALTVDHYYLPLDRQPRYQARKLRSDVDYDHVESMDSDLVGEHINRLLAGEEVRTPVYNMKTGFRDGEGTPMKLPDPVEKSMLVIEGIHALNPEFLKTVPSKRLFKVYISPISSLQLDEANALKTTDNRLLRRMSRDYLFRGHSASKTLSMWANVRRGEHTWIFPHQDAVDMVVNSSHEYEMAILKPLVEPLLAAVPPDDAQYAAAVRLLSLLRLFHSASTAKVPTTSLLREFIGDGAFDCH